MYQLDLFVLQLVSLRDLRVQNIIELLFLGKQRLCASHVLVVFLEEKVPDAILYLIQIAAYLHDLDVKLVKVLVVKLQVFEVIVDVIFEHFIGVPEVLRPGQFLFLLILRVVVDVAQD